MNGAVARVILVGYVLMSGYVQPMHIDRVIIGCDTNPTYIEFWPLVAKAWHKVVGVKPTLAFIAPAGTPIDTSVGDVIYFEPIPGVPTSLYAQTIRLLAPALYPNDVCIVSDMDMMPLSRAYFQDTIARISDTSFVTYHPWRNGDRIPMCYIAAKGSVFGNIFHVESREDIPGIVYAWNSIGLGWNTDELLLGKYLGAWEKNGGTVVSRADVAIRRIDRMNWRYNDDMLRNGYYTDSHMLRPYHTYKTHIDRIARILGII